MEVEGQLNAELSVIAFEVVIDVDGDGDGDDDNHRGKRGKGNSHGNANDNDNGGNDNDSIEVGAEITLASDTTDVNGKAETKYKEENGEVEQEVEVEIEHAVAGTIFTLTVSFAEQSVEFGTMTADDLGSAEAKFKIGDDDPNRDLSTLLPDGLDVRDITAVQILQDGSVIPEGNF